MFLVGIPTITRATRHFVLRCSKVFQHTKLSEFIQNDYTIISNKQLGI